MRLNDFEPWYREPEPTSTVRKCTIFDGADIALSQAAAKSQFYNSIFRPMKSLELLKIAKFRLLEFRSAIGSTPSNATSDWTMRESQTDSVSRSSPNQVTTANPK